jgi:vitamin B12 transporter
MRTALTALLFLLFKISLAQTITGTVYDAKNKPLPGVSIALKDAYDGATTDAAGKFTFTTSEKGSQVLTATAIGYKLFEYPLTVGSGVQQINIVLKEEITELKAVVISAGAFEASDRKKGTVLSSIDIVTTASANADVTGALKTLPGAQQVGESEGLFVRGGTATETKTFIDGTLVNNFFYSSVPGVAQRGRFSPFIFKGTVFSTGGYSALYGQALSSAVILESIDLPDQSSANLGISVIGASGGFQQLSKNKKSSWGLNYGYTNLQPAFRVLKQKQDYFKVPVFHTADANFRIKTSRSGMLKYYGYLSANKLGFRVASLDTLGYNDVFHLSNINSYHNLSYRESLGSGWKINIGTSYTNNRDAIEAALENGDGVKEEVQGLEFKNFALNAKSRYLNAKAVVEKRLAGLSILRFGSEYNYTVEKPLYTLYNGEKIAATITEKTSAAFAETDIYVTNDLAAKVGIRAEHASILEKWNVAPRISLAYKLGEAGQASLAYGTFYQNPETRYLPALAPLTYAKATHYIAQYQRSANDRTLRTEVFYKKYDHLLKTAVQDYRERAAGSFGFGDAKGFEVFWRDRKTVKGVDYWISYSYLDTKRNFLNFPYAIQPAFAGKHTASLVVKKFVQPWKTQFNAAYNYASGRPYYFIEPVNTGFEFSDHGTTPDYHNLSFSLNYLPSIGKTNSKNFVVYVFSVSNVLGFNQTYTYKYSYNGARKEAVVPPSKRFIFFGAFFSFGVDRSDDVINSNL